MTPISPAEKNDLLLALAAAFARKLGDFPADAEEENFAALAARYFAAAAPETLAEIDARARFLDGLDASQRRRWQEMQLDKMRRRGRALRLDENVNPSYLAEVLSRESAAVQRLILRNLPADLARRIVFYLELNFEIRHLDLDADGAAAPVADEINALVRRQFLANFVALEDLHEPDTLDRFPVAELETFVRHLGLREIALACRGIGSKETLAAFLNRFGEEDAREIALYITELEKIRPFWVAQADELVRQSWSADQPTEAVLKKIGLRLLAVAYAARSETSRRYAAQKMPVRDAKNWLKSVRDHEKLLVAADDEDTRENLGKRQKSVERLAARFAETGRL